MNYSYYICETCGSDDITRYSGNICYCYDCDSVSTCYAVVDDREYKTCPQCGRITPSCHDYCIHCACDIEEEQ